MCECRLRMCGRGGIRGFFRPLFRLAYFQVIFHAFPFISVLTCYILLDIFCCFDMGIINLNKIIQITCVNAF